MSIIVIIISFAQANSAWSLTCITLPIEDDIQRSDIIFSGTVQAISSERKISSYNQKIWIDQYIEFKVLEPFKGISSDTIIVRNNPIWVMAFEEQEKWVIFASHIDGILTINKCSNIQNTALAIARGDKLVEQQLTLADFHEKLNKDERTLPYPKQQSDAGVLPENIICYNGLELIFKASDNSPACVKSTTVQKLIDRGWASS